jgi:hypothetical protein
VIVAGDGADEIYSGPDGRSLRAVWRKWALVGGKAGQTIDPGLITEVTWSFQGNTLTRSEKIAAAGCDQKILGRRPEHRHHQLCR